MFFWVSLFPLLLSASFILRKRFCKCQITDQMCVSFSLAALVCACHPTLDVFKWFCFLSDSIRTCSCRRRRSCGCRSPIVPLHCRTASLLLSRPKDTFQSPPPCPHSAFICSLIGWPSLTCPPTAAEKPCTTSAGRQQWAGKYYFYYKFHQLVDFLWEGVVKPERWRPSWSIRSFTIFFRETTWICREQRRGCSCSRDPISDSEQNRTHLELFMQASGLTASWLWGAHNSQNIRVHLIDFGLMFQVGGHPFSRAPEVLLGIHPHMCLALPPL